MKAKTHTGKGNLKGIQMGSGTREVNHHLSYKKSTNSV